MKIVLVFSCLGGFAGLSSKTSFAGLSGRAGFPGLSGKAGFVGISWSADLTGASVGSGFAAGSEFTDKSSKSGLGSDVVASID